MFNNLYQIEQNGRQQQQAWLDEQARAEQARAAITPPASRRARVRRFRRSLAAVLQPRSAVAWLTRLLVVALALALGVTARPAAAATDPGNAAGHQAVVDPGNAAGNSAVTDPGDASGHQPTIDTGNASGHEPVIDPGNASGHEPVIDPGNASGHQPATDPGTSGGHEPRVAAATTSPAQYLFWLGLVAVFLTALALSERKHAAR